MTNTAHQALVRALYKVLRPMVRLLLRHGMSYRAFSDVARNVFVDVAEEEFSLPGRKPSHSRTAVLTGINRKDIAKLKDRPHPLSDQSLDAPNPAARVITAWTNDARFHDTAGAPKSLLVEEQATQPDSFTTLAKEYSSDVPVRALLDELVRIHAVEREGDGGHVDHGAREAHLDDARLPATLVGDVLRGGARRCGSTIASCWGRAGATTTPTTSSRTSTGGSSGGSMRWRRG